jgi:enoyl-CoA hydratase
MTTTVLCSTPRPGVAEVRFNRPHRLNAVVEPLFRETLDAAERDRDVRIVVVTGEGRAFCVGADLKEHEKAERTSWQKREYLLLAQEVCARIHRLKKPVIAAVNGYALGAVRAQGCRRRGRARARIQRKRH